MGGAGIWHEKYYADLLIQSNSMKGITLWQKNADFWRVSS
jgi:hypothetical protein